MSSYVTATAKSYVKKETRWRDQRRHEAFERDNCSEFTVAGGGTDVGGCVVCRRDNRNANIIICSAL